VGVSPGVIVAGFDVHRRQFTFDAVDTATGELLRGKIDSTPGRGRAMGRAVPRQGGARRGRGVYRLAVRRPRAGALWRGPASHRAGRDNRVAGSQAPREDRPDGRPLAPAIAARKGGCRSRGCRPSTFANGAPALGCATRWPASGPAGSSGSARCSTTTGSQAPREPATLAGREFLTTLERPIDATERIQVRSEG
jgi:hypothetical protein